MAKTDTAPVGIEQHLGYNPNTGKIVWLHRKIGGSRIIYPGDEAGTDKDGYRNINFHGTLYRAHRLAWFFMTGEWLPSKQDIDHINGDRSDNRWCNLRLVTRSQNSMNGHKLMVNNKSGVRGVSWRKDTCKWHARITVDGKTILLGDFVRKEDAIAARREAEIKYFGYYGNRPRLI